MGFSIMAALKLLYQVLMSLSTSTTKASGYASISSGAKGDERDIADGSIFSQELIKLSSTKGFWTS